jgi:PST family polysaccharide transporter
VNVALPALTRVKESPAMLARYFTIVLSALASSALPVGVLILALSDPLVRTVYGDRWAPAAPALAALAVFGINRVFIALLSDMLVVYGRTALFLKLQILWLVLLVPALVVLVHLAGTIGAGLAHILVAFPIMTPIFVMAVRKHGDWLTVRLLLKAAFPPLAASVLAGVVASFVAGQIHTPWLALIVGGFAGTLTYVVLLGRWLISTVRGFRAILSTDPSEASSDDDSVGPSHTERAQAASREAPGPGIAGTGSTVTEDGQPGEGRP